MEGKERLVMREEGSCRVGEKGNGGACWIRLTSGLIQPFPGNFGVYIHPYNVQIKAGFK